MTTDKELRELAEYVLDGNVGVPAATVIALLDRLETLEKADTGPLDAAWAAALAAFPDGWNSVNIWPPFPGDPWAVQVTKQVRFGRGGASRYNRIRGQGSDLAAALRDLATALLGKAEQE